MFRIRVLYLLICANLCVMQYLKRCCEVKNKEIAVLEVKLKMLNADYKIACARITLAVKPDTLAAWIRGHPHLVCTE